MGGFRRRMFGENSDSRVQTPDLRLESSERSRACIAVDLGASGGRVALGWLEDGKLGSDVRARLELNILHRFANGPVPVPTASGERLYWDILNLWKEVLHGLKLCAQRARALGRSVSSVGVDSWAVDYALLDQNGFLLDGVHHYRSSRLEGVMAGVLEGGSREMLFEHTGLQFLPFNTLYQLLAQGQEQRGTLERAATLLMVPDLLHHWLGGRAVCERTNASTTQFYDPGAREWSRAVLEAQGLPTHILPELVDAGTDLGELSSEVAQLTGLEQVRIIAPGTHDTASAVVAAPLEGLSSAYLSSGTWSLLGLETASPVMSLEALEGNFTNEAGVDGTNRLLRNVMGLWILQECRRGWGDLEWDVLYREAELAESSRALLPHTLSNRVLNVDDPRFLNPGLDMPERVVAVALESGLMLETRGEIVRAVLEGLAHRYAQVLAQLERITATSIHTLHIVGGGSQVELLNEFTANITGKRVVAGPVDATLIGNLLVQMSASGQLEPLERRETVRRSFVLREYLPANQTALSPLRGG